MNQKHSPPEEKENFEVQGKFFQVFHNEGVSDFCGILYAAMFCEFGELSAHPGTITAVSIYGFAAKRSRTPQNRKTSSTEKFR